MAIVAGPYHCGHAYYPLPLLCHTYLLLCSLEQMVVPPPLLASLRSLVALEKARALLHAAP